MTDYDRDPCDFCDHDQECPDKDYEPDWEGIENAHYQYKTEAIHWGGMDIPS